MIARLARAAALAALASLLGACSTSAFCFRDCTDEETVADAGGDVDAGDRLDGGDAACYPFCGKDGGDADACVPTNGGVEICDGVDNDCDGIIDDGTFTTPDHCGTCDNDCTKLVQSAVGITCDAPKKGVPGTCGYTTCAPGRYDVDGNHENGCEYYCQTPKYDANGNLVKDEKAPEYRCNGQDDNCNGLIDEDENLCDDALNCGACGRSCQIPSGHAQVACVHTGSGACDTSNTACQLTGCDTGWYDADKNPANGCEYACTPTGVEICDGKDNDCNGLIDQADPGLNDPKIGVTCQGGTQGICADPAHAGKTVCDTGNIDCKGANVITKNQVAETCNGLDDDCDGIVDDNVPTVGDACGKTLGICQPGAIQCVLGGLICVGGTGAQPEVCNGVDDDCDGYIDDNLTDTGVSCGLSVGACKPGITTCTGGSLSCVGGVAPATEVCNGLDDDCNGLVDDNPAGQGTACGSNVGACKAGTKSCVNGSFACVGGVLPTAETCNGVDDDCNGNIDDGVPGTGVACGVTTGTCKAGVILCQSGKLDCYGEVTGTAETCNQIDDDCDGVVDGTVPDAPVTCGSDADCASQGVYTSCLPVTGQSIKQCAKPPTGTGGTCGSSVGACKQGTNVCQSGQIVCAGSIGPTAETCNGIDDDCNGKVDDAIPGIGNACGTAVGTCAFGTQQCNAGISSCVGAINPTTETCNGIDDDCDGVIDGTAASPAVACNVDADCASQGAFTSCLAVYGQTTKTCSSLPAGLGVACNVPTAPPAGATSACKAGTLQCVTGSPTCVGSVTATTSVDACGVDSNCDGQLTNQPNLQTDVHNCGACGNDCTAGAVHANWTCTAGACQFLGCQTGYYDNGGPGDAVAGDKKCGYACTFVSAAEACNGVDDNCNGVIDENVTAPSTAQVCGVGFGATEAGCTTGVSVTCTSGKWQCVFPSGYCGGNGSTPATSTSCSTAADVCDGKDNNCNGLADEGYKRPLRTTNVLNDPCTNNGIGNCKQSGTYVCNAAGTDTTCSAGPVSCSSLAGGCTELCDGIDNDCDGSVDEPYTAKGSNAAYFVAPAVTKVANALWMFSYEASRPSATTISAGSGDGWTCSQASCLGTSPSGTVPLPAAGTTLDATPACSVANKVPWFNVLPGEAEQACNARGGRICTTAEWQTAVSTNPPGTTTCTYGYAPNGTACTSGYTGTKFCNLGVSFDFDGNSANGMQGGLLPTASSKLTSCYGDWTALLANGTTNGKLYDITGNLREITKSAANVYPLMGGGFTTQTEAGAARTFTFYSVNSTFELYDTGFRCCFTSDPTK